MTKVAELLSHAARCNQLACVCTDVAVAAKLRRLEDDYRELAAEYSAGLGEQPEWPCSEIPANPAKVRGLIQPQGGGKDLFGHIATSEPRFRSRQFTWLLTAAVSALIIEAAVLTHPVTQGSNSYRTASAITEGAIVYVRFVPQASMADLSKFLDAYKASIVGGPQPTGFYRLRISETALPQAELAKIVSRIAHEKIIAFAAAAQ